MQDFNTPPHVALKKGDAQGCWPIWRAQAIPMHPACNAGMWSRGQLYDTAQHSLEANMSACHVVIISHSCPSRLSKRSQLMA